MPQTRRVYTGAVTVEPAAQPAPAPAGKRIYTGAVTPEPDEPEIPSWRRYGAMALRGLGTVVGAVGGGLVGSVPGAIAGGAAGGGLGEWGAELLEGRDRISPLEIATQTALGAVPIKGGSILKQGLKAAGMGGAGSAAYTLNEEGIPQDAEGLGSLARSTATGAVVGGGAGAGVAKLLQVLGRGGAPSARAILREEAENARPAGRPALEAPPAPGTGVPPSAPLAGEFGELPSTGTRPSPSRFEQVMGLDPAGVVDRTVNRSRQGVMPRPRPGRLTPPEVVNDSSVTGHVDPWFSSELAPPKPGRLTPPTVVDEAYEGIPEPLDLNTIPGVPSVRPPVAEAPDLMETISRAVNGSGDSSASMEALSRQRGMQAKGEQFVVYGRDGVRRPLLGPDAVDYAAREGETFGIEGPNGFQKLDDRGGRAPVASAGAVVPPARDPGDPFGVQPGSATLDAPEASGNSEIDGLIGMLTGKQAPEPFTEPVRAIDRARETGKAFFPAEVVSTLQKLRPKWEQTAAETGVDMREDPTTFLQRIFGEANPRKLMGAERKAVKAARSRLGTEDIPTGPPVAAKGQEPLSSPPAVQRGGFLDKILGDDRGGPAPTDADFRDFGDEIGGIDPALLQRLGIHVGSAGAGATAAGVLSDDENRTKNMIGGAALGAAGPALLTKGGLESLGRLRYFSMLGSTGAQATNLVGNAGSVVVKAAEEAATGNVDSAKRLLSEVFSPETVRHIGESFRNAPTDSERWGKNTGVLGVFSRIMHAVDEAVTEGMERGGLSRDEAQTSLFTSEPKSRAGKWIASRPDSLSALMPFVRTPVNIVERGLEHTPGIGMLPAVRGMRDASDKEVMARQAMGALALLTGATVGADKYGTAALGPLGLPLQLGARGREAYDKRGDDFTNIVKGLIEQTGRSLPLPTGTSATPFNEPGRFLASHVPSVLRDASLIDPREFEQSGLFDPSIAKVPFLNEALLRRKPKPKRRAAAR